MLLAAGQSPYLTPEVIDRCKNAGIRTVLDFLSTEPEDLCQMIGMSYKDVSCIQSILLSIYSSCVRNGELLYQDHLQAITILSTGCSSLDEHLGGGIFSGEITEFHGGVGSGKTQLCLNIASDLIMNTNCTALYLDTNGGFVARHLRQMLLKKSQDPQTIKESLEKLRVINPQDVFGFFDVLHSVTKELCIQEDPFFSNLKLLILDSITPIMSPCIGSRKLNGQGLLMEAAQLLKALCKDHYMSVVVCNNMVSGGSCDKPALGTYWSFVPSVRLRLKKDLANEDDVTSVLLVKSCRRGLFEMCIAITEDGISPARES